MIAENSIHVRYVPYAIPWSFSAIAARDERVCGVPISNAYQATSEFPPVEDSPLQVHRPEVCSSFMALSPRTPASHNQMLGRRIAHPPSTNFDEDFPIPAAKRTKRLDNVDGSPLRLSPEDGNLDGYSRPSFRRTAVTESEDESDTKEEQIPSANQTELESALPPVKTDKEAIAEYEATRAAETDLDLHSRLGQRKWVQGKSSIYVDAFFLALETVLDEESPLFDEAEMAVFQKWRDLSYEGQYLYVGINHSTKPFNDFRCPIC